jgi:hypothetical protein
MPRGRILGAAPPKGLTRRPTRASYFGEGTVKYEIGHRRTNIYNRYVWGRTLSGVCFDVYVNVDFSDEERWIINHGNIGRRVPIDRTPPSYAKAKEEAEREYKKTGEWPKDVPETREHWQTTINDLVRGTVQLHCEDLGEAVELMDYAKDQLIRLEAYIRNLIR